MASHVVGIRTEHPDQRGERADCNPAEGQLRNHACKCPRSDREHDKIAESHVAKPGADQKLARSSRAFVRSGMRARPDKSVECEIDAAGESQR